MEPTDIPLSPSRPGSPSPSRSSSLSPLRSALPSPSLPASEWPFPALSRSRSSSLSLSSWPFVAGRSPSVSVSEQYSWSPNESLPSSDPHWRYKPVPAKDWVGIYPPVLPAPDFFDEEEIEEWIEKSMFKKDDAGQNWLYDETGKVNLPVNEKGMLILDPVSRTRIIDARMERYILAEYSGWILSASYEARGHDNEQSVGWLGGLRKVVDQEYLTVIDEFDVVIDEERKKWGLTDLKTHKDWWHSTGSRLWQNRGNDEAEDGQSREDTDCQSESQWSPRTAPLNGCSNTDDATVSDDPESIAQDDEELHISTSHELPLVESTTAREDTPTTPPLDLVALWW